jgi:hypothetical protein
MEFYSATKKNEILLSVGKWMELENISLSEASQAQIGQKPYDIFIFLPCCEQLILRVSIAKEEDEGED